MRTTWPLKHEFGRQSLVTLPHTHTHTHKSTSANKLWTFKSVLILSMFDWQAQLLGSQSLVSLCTKSYPLCVRSLKPHVRHQQVYGMGTSGFIVDPRDYSHTMHLRKAQNAGSAGKRTRPGVHRQNGHPSYIGAYVRTKCTSQNSSRQVHVIGVVAYRGCLAHKPMTAHYLVLPDASA